MAQDANNKNSLNTLMRKNRHDVLQAIRHSEPLSIAEIAQKTSLSKVTVTKSLDFYVKEGVVVSLGKGDSSEDGGKRPNIFTFNPDYRYVFCVKVVDYYLLAALTNIDGDMSASHTVFFDRKTPLDSVLKSIGEAFRLLLKRQKIDVSRCLGVAIGCPGIADVQKGVLHTAPHFSNWGRNIPMADLLQKHLPKGVPVYIDNSTHFHAYGEAKSASTRVDRFFIVSSEMEGINGGLMVDGQLYRGIGCLSGEVGHMIVDTSENAEVCQCGGKGCLEAVVSPLRMQAKARSLLPECPKSSLHVSENANGPLFADILEAANRGDPLARRLVDESVRHFAVGLNNVLQICDPGLIVIQGEYARAGEYFRKTLGERIRVASLSDFEKSVQIEYSQFGDEGAIIGAGSHIADMYINNTDWS